MKKIIYFFIWIKNMFNNIIIKERKSEIIKLKEGNHYYYNEDLLRH